MIVLMPNGDIVATTDKEADACERLTEGAYERDSDDPRRFTDPEAEAGGCSNCRGL